MADRIIERETVVHDEPDVVVTGGGRSGVGAGMILGILIVIIAIAFGIWYFGFGAGGHSTTNINVAPPQIQVSGPASS